jgi:hypothetical protein
MALCVCVRRDHILIIYVGTIEIDRSGLPPDDRTMKECKQGVVKPQMVMSSIDTVDVNN